MDSKQEKNLGNLFDDNDSDNDKIEIPAVYGVETLTLSNVSDTITLSSNLWDNTMINNGFAGPNITLSSPGQVFTVGNGVNTSPWYNNSASPKIKLNGEDADIEINGISLLKTMQDIQSRLNLLQPNIALEAEWAELFELGKKYRALEQHIKDKQATWDKLKAMPPPELD